VERLRMGSRKGALGAARMQGERILRGRVRNDAPARKRKTGSPHRVRHRMAGALQRARQAPNFNHTKCGLRSDGRRGTRSARSGEIRPHLKFSSHRERKGSHLQ
jgi:hypothetical protein